MVLSRAIQPFQIPPFQMLAFQPWCDSDIADALAIAVAAIAASAAPPAPPLAVFAIVVAVGARLAAFRIRRR